MSNVTFEKDVVSDPSLKKMTPRVSRLYEVLKTRMEKGQKRWGQHVSIFEQGSEADLPIEIRHSLSFEKALLEMPVEIEKDDLIVGNTLENGVVVRVSLPWFLTDEEYKDICYNGAEHVGKLSHKTPYYRRLLEIGIAGIIERVDEKISVLKEHPVENAKKLNFFESIKRELNAVVAFAHRYADIAERQYAIETDTGRKAELERIAAICRRVPEFPPRTFWEAVQSFWFVQYLLFTTGTNIACGRIDQFLYPYLKDDLEYRRISLDEAQEIIDCLWLRFNDRAQICRDNFYNEIASSKREIITSNRKREVPAESCVVDESISNSWVWQAGHRNRFSFLDDAADAVNHFGQNILLSGIRPDGEDGTNELTYICLNSLEKFSLTSPVVTVRLHRDSPPELVHRSAEVLKNGGGMPYIDNDDIIIPAYTDLGVPVEDARDYANSNCWETMIQGKSDQELVRGINFLLYLELALNRGYSIMHREKLGPDTGDPGDFSSIDDVMEAWRGQLDYQIESAVEFFGKGVREDTLEHSSHGRYCYNPFLSALILDSIEKEKDVIHSGARYVIWHLMAEAVADTANALAVIKKLVFEEKEIAIDQLLDALKNDWKGYENLRRKFLARVPKFANDDDYVDSIARDLMDAYIDTSRHHAKRYPEVIFPCSVGTYSWYAMIGKEVSTTPDGRHKGDPVAANFSPVPGTDLSGPTAAINSYVKMRVGELAGGAPIDLKFSKTTLKGDEGTRRLAGLIQAFIVQGGNMMTLTVTDVEELKRAMAEPDKYRHLRVRMGGWSAYFVMLGKEQQRVHIERVEHGLA